MASPPPSSVLFDLPVQAKYPQFDFDLLKSSLLFVSQRETNEEIFIRLRSADSLDFSVFLEILSRTYECTQSLLSSSSLRTKVFVLPEIQGQNHLVDLESIATVFSHDLSKEDVKALEELNSQRKVDSLPPFKCEGFPPPHHQESQSDEKNRCLPPLLLLTSKSFQYSPKYQHSVLGGTFDHLHDGHKILLSAAALNAQNTVHVGVTEKELLQKKKHAEFLEPFEDRERQVRHFIRVINRRVGRNTFPLRDPFGPTITDGSLDLIVLSMENGSAIQKINEKRAEKGLDPLDHTVIDYLLDVSKVPNYLERLQQGTLKELQTEEYKISSTTIRQRLGKM